jgi:hypothetical protein
MFGKVKKLFQELEVIWASVDAHAKDIAQLEKDLAALKKDVRTLVPAKAAAKPAAKKSK